MNSKFYLLLIIVISIRATLCIAQTANLNSIPKGTIEKCQFKESKIYPGTERNITVYIPAQINQSKPACVYVSQDGHKQQFTDAMDILINSKGMPVTVGIFISPGTMPSLLTSGGSRGNRGYEYNSLGDNYARFLIEDVLPFISKKYNLNLSENGNDRCIGGVSSGGICAFNVAWERPNDFRRVYSNSGSFVAYCGGDIIPVLIRKCEAKPIRIFLHGAKNDLDNAGGNFWLTHLNMENALAFAGYDYKAQWSEGKHGDRYGEAFEDAMRFLWNDYPAPVSPSLEQPYIRNILIPEEKWTLVGEGYHSAGSLTATSKGEVVGCDALANRLYKIDPEGKEILYASNAKQVCGLTTGTDGRIYGISKVTGKVQVFDENGDSKVIAKGVLASALVACPGGGFYAAGNEKGISKVWHISMSGEVRVVDTGLKNATGCAISVNGMLLHVADGGSHFIYSYMIGTNGDLSGKEHSIWLHIPDNEDNSGAEAICMDSTGRIFASTKIGIWVGSDQPYHNQCIISAPSAHIFGLCFGGPEFNVLYASCGDKLFKRKVQSKGHHFF